MIIGISMGPAICLILGQVSLSFRTPPKYSDVTRSSHIDLDVLQEKRIDDYWMSIRADIVRFLERIHKVYIYFLKKNLQKEYVFREKTDKDSNDGPDQIMYGQKFGRTSVKPLRIEIKQEWTKEKPKLDNARRMKEIYTIDPEDE